jgi:hypothetical protein
MSSTSILCGTCLRLEQGSRDEKTDKIEFQFDLKKVLYLTRKYQYYIRRTNLMVNI